MDGLIGRDLITIEVEMLKALFPEEEEVLKVENYFNDDNHDLEKRICTKKQIKLLQNPRILLVLHRFII